MKNSLPPQWTECPLQECVEVLDNQRVPINSNERNKRKGDIPYYGATGQVGWIDDWLFDEELVLLGEDGAPFFDKTKSIAYLINSKSWVNNHAHVLRAIKDITSNKFIKNFLDRFDFNGYVNGTTRLKLTQGKMNKIPISLPPLNEQNRIVAKLDQLLPKVQTSQERLEKIPIILKRFRQSVLEAACSGKLTEDWRKQNTACVPASEIIKTLKTPTPDSHLDIFERSSGKPLPDTWVWSKLGTLGQMKGGGTPSKSNPSYWKGEIPWVSPKDMKRDRIHDSEDHISKAALEASSTSEIPPGSILFVVRGMILNHTFPTAITDSIVTLNQDMKALIPEKDEMSEYLFLASKYIAPSILFAVKEATHGTRRIESPILKNWAIPIPPIDEQQEIVHRVEALFKVADSIEERYNNAKASVDKLTQSILAKAFRGELVPQDPNDEPAEELLKRIRAKKEEQKLDEPSKKKQRSSKAHISKRDVANG